MDKYRWECYRFSLKVAEPPLKVSEVQLPEGIERAFMATRYLGLNKTKEYFAPFLEDRDRRVRFYAARALALFAHFPLHLVNHVYTTPEDFDEDLDLTEVASVVRRIEKGSPDEYRKLLVDALQYQDPSRSGIVAGALLRLLKSEPDQEIQDAAFTVLRSLGVSVR